MKKLGKNLKLVERTVEAYECTNCQCSGCPCSCTGSSTLDVASTNGAQYEMGYEGGTVLVKWA